MLRPVPAPHVLQATWALGFAGLRGYSLLCRPCWTSELSAADLRPDWNSLVLIAGLQVYSPLLLGVLIAGLRVYTPLWIGHPCWMSEAGATMGRNHRQWNFSRQ